jgi:flagellar hook protein FlgE
MNRQELPRKAQDLPRMRGNFPYFALRNPDSPWHDTCAGGRKPLAGEDAMSLYSSMNTALSGMNAQSRALGHISDNVANSQTVGFKRTDTNFVSYISESSSDVHRPGTVLARPDFTNQVQGTIEQVENPLALAISGQGFFTAALPIGKTEAGDYRFDARQFYTRAGDFNRNSEGLMVNGSGYVLQGWPVTDGEVDKTQLVPIQVQEDVFTPTPTQELTFGGNLAAGGTANQSTSIQVIDTLGRSRALTLTFAPTVSTTDNTWTLSISSPDATPSTIGSIPIRFGQDGAVDQPDGTLAEFGTGTGLSGSAAATGGLARVTFNADFGQGAQAMVLNLGRFGVAGGLTQFASTAASGLSVNSFEQDGIPIGAFSSVTTQRNGDVRINYDNGQSRVVARVPITVFKDADRLQHLDGQAFLRTIESGEARIVEAGEDGAGLISVSAVERSNVDIATEFSKLILAQRAYSANTKIVSAVDDLLQETLNMRR